MIAMRSRIPDLIQRLEAGEIPTSREFRILGALQALDIAKFGTDVVHASAAEEERRTAEFADIING